MVRRSLTLHAIVLMHRASRPWRRQRKRAPSLDRQTVVGYVVAAMPKAGVLWSVTMHHLAAGSLCSAMAIGIIGSLAGNWLLSTASTLHADAVIVIINGARAAYKHKSAMKKERQMYIA
jgi:uncharacterized membrane protein YjjB (DUF3815 family)